MTPVATMGVSTRATRVGQERLASHADHPSLAPLQAEALLGLLGHLRDIGYQFVTPTPATHARVLARQPGRTGTTLSDVLGWSLPFHAGAIEPAVAALLGASGMLVQRPDGLLQSAIRVSSLHGRLFIHSAYPTEAEDAVFLGPDSYRFADLIERVLGAWAGRSAPLVLDIGAGAGVGALVAADRLPAARIVMTDINPRALTFAQINARHAGYAIDARLGRNLAGWRQGADIVLANPPYVIDPAGRAYRDGGTMHGGAVALEMTETALDALHPGGLFILYTGSAIVAGEDPLRVALCALAERKGVRLDYRELDPDVFGEELENPAYADVERIAVVGGLFSAAARV